MAFKILTVDDSKTIRMIVGRIFRPYGCEIFEAANGIDGLVMAGVVKPDLIFLDITMPGGMDGLEMLDQLRHDEVLLAIPVIMLTSESSNKAIERADQLLVAGYVAKPFTPEQLIEQAARVLDFQSAAA